MSLPGQPPRGRGSDSGGHPAMSAGRGAVLVGLAVVAGLLIFATIDDDGGGTASTPAAETTTLPTTQATNVDGTPVTTAAGTTETTKAKKNKTSTTARPNDQVLVQVLNGSGLQGAATNRSNDLKAKGYQLLSANNAPSDRNGTAVQCIAGFEKEADSLVIALGDLGVTATVGTVPAPLPAGFDILANCYVILGK